MRARPAEQVRAHYDIERELAARLRAASREERRTLYTSLYDELFRRVPHHPQLARKEDAGATSAEVQHKMRLVGRYLRREDTFLEIGPGDCAFSFEVAERVASVIAIDVSTEVVKRRRAPPNFTLVVSDGSAIPVPTNSVDVAYSNQLMEHLHPDDAEAQLRAVFAALKPHGRYICITPSRHSGPHDVSRHFDEEATGFHLHEYSYAEICALFRKIGFVSFAAYVGGKGLYMRCPVTLLRVAERTLALLPRSIGRRLARSHAGRAVFGLNLVACKPAR